MALENKSFCIDGMGITVWDFAKNPLDLHVANTTVVLKSIPSDLLRQREFINPSDDGESLMIAFEGTAPNQVRTRSVGTLYFGCTGTNP